MFLLMARWLDTHREEKRIIATKNAKIAKKGRAKGFLRCVVVRGLTTPQKRTVENSHKERRDRTGGWAKCFFRCPVVRESLLSEEGSEIATKIANGEHREVQTFPTQRPSELTHREEKRIIATKNAKIAKKGRAKCFFRCVVVRGLTTP